jgi:hypothetical protein
MASPKEVPIIWINDGDDGNEAAEVTDEFIGVTLWLFGMCMLLLGVLLWLLSVDVCMSRGGGKRFAPGEKWCYSPSFFLRGIVVPPSVHRRTQSQTRRCRERRHGGSPDFNKLEVHPIVPRDLGWAPWIQTSSCPYHQQDDE